MPFEVLRSGLTVRGLDPVAVGAAAAAGGVALSSLHRRGPALEEVFLDLVNGTRVHASAAGVGALSPVRGTDAAAVGRRGGSDVGGPPAGAADASRLAAGLAGPAEPSAPEAPAVAAASPEQDDSGRTRPSSRRSARRSSTPRGRARRARPPLSAQPPAPRGRARRGTTSPTATHGWRCAERRRAQRRLPKPPSTAAVAEAPGQRCRRRRGRGGRAGADDLPPAAQPAPTEPAPPWYAVASTGVIDIVPAAAQEQPGDDRAGAAGRGPAGAAGTGFRPPWWTRSLRPTGCRTLPRSRQEAEDAADDPWAPEDSEPRRRSSG